MSKQEKQILAFYDALKRISLYDAPDRLRKRAQKDYGLCGGEAVEMAYENVLNEARMAIRGKRRPVIAPVGGKDKP